MKDFFLRNFIVIFPFLFITIIFLIFWTDKKEKEEKIANTISRLSSVSSNEQQSNVKFIGHFDYGVSSFETEKERCFIGVAKYAMAISCVNK